jgi:putative transposase
MFYNVFMNITVKVKLLPTPEQAASLLKTIEAFNDACNYVSGVAFKNHIFGQVALHHKVYRYIRETYSLSAQMAVRAVAKVSESYVAERKRLHVFKKYSAVPYDRRILSFKGLDTASILSLDGRLKMPMVIGGYAKLDMDKVRGHADLLYVKGKFYLALVQTVPDGTPIDPEGILGIDLGLVNIAATSDGETFSGSHLDTVRERRTAHKKALQSKGTKNAKRRLKKVAGKESRFRHDVNHCISKRIVQRAKDTRCAIALEDLKGIRDRTTVRKAQRQRFGSWSFFQLRTFLEYKAKLAGVPVFTVDPRNTSRECSACGFVSKLNRTSQAVFSCRSCGTTLNADLNGAINIARRAAANPPIAVHVQAPSSPLWNCKPPALAGGR